MKIFLTTFLILLFFTFFGFRYFIYYDKDINCLIRLKPPLFELSSINIKDAIKALKYAVPEEYQKLCTYVDVIDPKASCGGFQGGCYNAYGGNIKEIQIGTATDDFLGWTASVIAHETCHAIQFQTKGIKGLEEKECYAIGDKVMKNLIYYK